MPKRDVAIEILSPTQGLHYELGSSFIQLRSTPNCLDANAYYGVVQKEYGTTIFATGGTGTGHILTVPANFIYEAMFGSDRVIEVFNNTGIHKYSSGTDAFVLDGQVCTGTFTDFWSVCMHNDEMVFVNAVTTMQVKLAYNSTGTNLGGVTTAANAAHTVISFANHLNVYNTVESGNPCYKRVRWTKVGLLGHTSTDWTSGTAGFVDLMDMEGNLITAAKMGNAGVAIYGENSIHVQEWVGGTDVYRFTKMLTNVGTPCPRGVVANDMIHYFIGRDNIYSYQGGRDIKAIGDAIKSKYIEDISQANIDYAFIDYVKENDEVRVYIPTGTDTYPTICYIYKVNDDSWYRLSRPYTCVGKVTEAPSGVTIGELLGDIGAQNWKFGDYMVRAGASLTVFGDQSGRVIQKSNMVYSISNSGTQSAQTFVFDTKDISSVGDIDPFVRDRYNLTSYMDNKSRWYEVKIEAKGSGSMYVEYSTDAGANWTACNPAYATLTPEWYMYIFEIDEASENVMLRIKNSGINEVVHVRFIKTRFIVGSEV
jgi:hypothetical protein